MGYSLNLTADYTAHSLVLKLVGSKKDVLEVGCASGYMSKVLIERGCTVVGIEIEEAGAARAREFCKEVIRGSVESEEVLAQIPGEFDVIVLADVLEHLVGSGRTLARLRPLLREEGYVVVSMPNVANWKIRGGLLMGRFDYEETGILDKTHLRFFTKKSAEELIVGSGYTIQEFCPGATRMPKLLVNLFPTLFAVHLVFKATPKK